MAALKEDGKEELIEWVKLVRELHLNLNPLEGRSLAARNPN